MKDAILAALQAGQHTYAELKAKVCPDSEKQFIDALNELTLSKAVEHRKVPVNHGWIFEFEMIYEVAA